MFTGEYNYNLDTKGRLSVPSKYREELGEEFWVSKWLDGCCVIFTKERFESMAQQLEASSVVKGRNVNRFLYSGAVMVSCDKQGRILLPQSLRRHAGLEGDITVIGANRYAEIWDTSRWLALEEEISGTITQQMEELEF